MKRSDFVIVIGRQYGSGGRELGQMLARRLGIPYYDKALLSEAAGRLGFRADLFERADEKRPSFFSSLLSANYGSSTYIAPGAMHNATLYQMQSDVIRNLMDSPCVIVGRTADYIGRERKNVVSIFLHADNAYRVSRTHCLHPGLPDDSAAMEIMAKKDAERQTYYNYFTGRKWGDAANYHLSLCTSLFSTERAADLVCRYLDLMADEIGNENS